MTAFDLDALLARHPLPWTATLAIEDDPRCDAFYVLDANAEKVGADLIDWYPEWLARLLAAAPGMVKAINAAIEFINDEGKGSLSMSTRPSLILALKDSLP